MYRYIQTANTWRVSALKDRRLADEHALRNILNQIRLSGGLYPSCRKDHAGPSVGQTEQHYEQSQVFCQVTKRGKVS